MTVGIGKVVACILMIISTMFKVMSNKHENVCDILDGATIVILVCLVAYLQ